MAAEYTANLSPTTPPCLTPAAASLGERFCFCWRSPWGLFVVGREGRRLQLLSCFHSILTSFPVPQQNRGRQQGQARAITYISSILPSGSVPLLFQRPLLSHCPLIPKSSNWGSGEVLRRDGQLSSSSPGKNDFLRGTGNHRAVNTHCIPEEEEGGSPWPAPQSACTLPLP